MRLRVTKKRAVLSPITSAFYQNFLRLPEWKFCSCKIYSEPRRIFARYRFVMGWKHAIGAKLIFIMACQSRCDSVAKKSSQRIESAERFHKAKKEIPFFFVVLNGEIASTKSRQRACFLCRFVL